MTGATRVVHTGGVDELAQSITGWQQTYEQTSPGIFQGELVELLLGPAQVFAESSSRALVQRCKTWPDAVWIGIPGSASEHGRIEGMLLDNCTVAVGRGGVEFQLVTPKEFVFLGIVVNVAALRDHATTHDVDDPLRQLECHLLKLSAEELQRFSQFVRGLLESTATLPADRFTNTVRCQILESLFEALLATLRSGQPLTQESVSSMNARRTIRRTREFVEHNNHRSITVQELCNHLGTSRRALQNCFKRSLDLSPKTYLRASALNAVRRELRMSEAGPRRVGDVAARYGFWHLSQFAGDYFSMFGELPSTTLRRSGTNTDRAI